MFTPMSCDNLYCLISCRFKSTLTLNESTYLTPEVVQRRKWQFVEAALLPASQPSPQQPYTPTATDDQHLFSPAEMAAASTNPAAPVAESAWEVAAEAVCESEEAFGRAVIQELGRRMRQRVVEVAARVGNGLYLKGACQGMERGG
jgi:hypothetical protein